MLESIPSSWAYSFNGKTSVSKTEVPGSSPGGPATTIADSERSRRLFCCGEDRQDEKAGAESSRGAKRTGDGEVGSRVSSVAKKTCDRVLVDPH